MEASRLLIGCRRQGSLHGRGVDSHADEGRLEERKKKKLQLGWLLVSREKGLAGGNQHAS